LPGVKPFDLHTVQIVRNVQSIQNTQALSQNRDLRRQNYWEGYAKALVVSSHFPGERRFLVTSASVFVIAHS